MKRLLTFFLICFSFVEYTRAEDIIDYKYWDEGKLTWDDFQDTLSLKGVPSAFNAFLRIEKTEKRDGNTRTIRPEAQACFDKRHSFADRQIQNENLLRLFQLKYDLLEMYRRRLQTELNLGVVGIAADNRTRQYMDLYTEKSKKAEQETENGQNEIKLQEWEFYVTKELTENPAPSIPRISPRRFGYGFYLGTGASFPVGNIADYWAPAWQINVGFDLAYANTHLLCGDFSLMCLYNCSCHRKADSIAAAFPGPRHIRTVEAVKEAVEITFRQGIAGILHRKFCFFAVFSPENVDFSTLRSVFNGVIHKKRNELVDSCGISFHMEFFCNIALQRDPARMFFEFTGKFKKHPTGTFAWVLAAGCSVCIHFLFFSARLRSSSFAPAYNRKYTVRIITTTILLSFRLKKEVTLIAARNSSSDTLRSIFSFLSASTIPAAARTRRTAILAIRFAISTPPYCFRKVISPVLSSIPSTMARDSR